MSNIVEKRVLSSKVCVARTRRGMNGPNCYSQSEGYMSVDYINNEPVSFSLCPSRRIPKGFEGIYISERIDSFPQRLFRVIAREDYKGLMPRKSFLKKLAEARAIDSDRIRSNWEVIL